MAITPNPKPPEIPTKTIRLTDFSMGLNSTISGSLLSDKELQVAKNISLEQKGTIMPGKGRRKRYDEPFSAHPCCGIGSYYKNDGISRLLIASHDTLYTDKPSISAKWDTQVEWGKEGTSLSSLGTVSEVDGSFTKLGSLMGLNGNCVDADYLLTTGCTAVTDEEVFKFAPKALKATLTATQGTLSKLRGDLPVRSNTHYALSAYVRNGNLKTGLSLATLDYAGTIIKESSVIKPSAWEKLTLKLTSTDMANATSIAVVLKGTSGQYGYVDGIVLVPITVLDYADSTYVAPDLTAIEPSEINYVVDTKAKWDAGTLDGVASTDDDTLILGISEAGIDAALEDDWETGAVFTDVGIEADKLVLVRDGTAFSYVEDTTAELGTGVLSDVVAIDNTLKLGTTLGSALSFDGTDRVVHPDTTAPRVFSPGTGDFTLEAAIKTTNSGATYRRLIAGKSLIRNTMAGEYDIAITTGGRASGDIRFNTGTGRVLLESSTRIDDNVVHRVSFVVDRDGYASLYVDGVLEDRGSVSAYSAVNMDWKVDFRIGDAEDSETDVNFVGVISDVRYWNVARSQSAIDADKFKRLTGDETGLVGYWKLDEGLGNTALETVSSTGASITGAMWTTGIISTYKASGYKEETIDLTSSGVTSNKLTLSWNDDTSPLGTTVTAQTAVSTDNGSTYSAYKACTNGGEIPDTFAGLDLSTVKVKVKLSLATTKEQESPVVTTITVAALPPYKTAGSWVSPPLHVESRPLTVGALALGTVLPSASTEASVEYAVSVDRITWSDWVALSSTVLPSGVEEYLKIRILLTTSDTSTTPEITSCEVTYPSIFSTSGEWLSEVLDLTSIDDDCMSLVTSVVDVTPAGTDVTLYCRSRMDAQAPWGAWTEQNTGVAIASLGGLVQFKYVLTTSTTATPSVASLAVIVTPTQGRALWVSEIVDVSQALDKSSGKGVINSELVGGKITVYSRSYSALDASPSTWYEMLEDGTLVHPENNYVQIALEIIGVKPIINDFTLSFDGAPTATTLLTGLSTGAEYSFTTLKDVLIIANGKDTPMSWDGTGVPVPLTGSPPTLDHVLTHHNRVWGTDSENKSRVRFSNILDPSTWDVLNFIDFNPEDGDYITALKRSGEDLVVAKQRSMALLTGSSTYNYSVVWLDTEQGATGKRATCNANKYFVYVSQDGIRFTDFNTSVIASERLLPLWAGINKRRLSQAAAVFWRNMILIALPNGNSLYNNIVLCYDFLRNAWFVREGWNVNAWEIFQQYGEDVLLATDSLTGQVYQVMLEEAYDDTVPVVYDVRIKDLTFDAPERYKLFRTINLDLESSLVDTSLEVDLIVDGVVVGTYSTTVPTTEKTVLVSTPIYDGEDNIIGYEDVPTLVPAKNKVQRMILPPLYNAVLGRSLSLAMRGRCGIQGIAIEFSYGGVVPDGGDTV